METDFMYVRHSIKETPARVSIEKKGFDLTNYSFLRMRPETEKPIAEWVPTEELDIYRKALGIE